jgi:hypothetical protein
MAALIGFDPYGEEDKKKQRKFSCVATKECWKREMKRSVDTGCGSRSGLRGKQ